MDRIVGQGGTTLKEVGPGVQSSSGRFISSPFLLFPFPSKVWGEQLFLPSIPIDTYSASPLPSQTYAETSENMIYK